MKKKLFNSKSKYFLFILSGFILFTIIGTLSHELGHWTAAKMLGFDARINYKSSNYDDSERIDQLYNLYQKKIASDQSNTFFEQEEEYNALKKETERDDLIIALAGPLQTIIVGSLGFIWLIVRRNKRKNHHLNTIDYLAIFLSLFWLREVFNPILSIGQAILLNGSSYFGGDEYYIAKFLGLSDGAIALPLALIGSLLSYIVVYKIIPKPKRSTFIDAALIGGIMGYILWMKILGPILLP